MNILFTCAGRRNYLINYFKEALNGSGKIYAADKDATATSLLEADVAIQVQDIYEANYIDDILNFSIHHKIDSIISLHDLELPLLAKHKSRFEDNGIHVIVSDPEVIDIAFDKYRTHQFLEAIGLNSPKTYITLQDAEEALMTDELSFPLILKPRWGSASIGIESVDTIEELKLAYQLLKIKLDKSILKKSASDFSKVILIQKQLPGSEFGLDIVNDLDGNYIGTFVRRKLKMRAGETDKAVSVIDERFNTIGEIIGKNLKHIGNLDCDVFEVNDKLYVLELNPRFGGGYPFSHEAGVNTAAMYISWMNNDYNVSKFNNYRADVLVTKYDRIIKIKNQL